MNMTETDTGPVTVSITATVKPGRERDFEEWLQGIGGAASAFAGHQGLNVLRPSGDSHAYVYIFRFDSYAHLKDWEESQERRQWVERLPDLTQMEPKRQMITGLEYWFTLPNAPGYPAPPRYKMMLLTLLVIYPLSTVLPPVLRPIISPLPLLLRGLVITILLVFSMTYIIMPRVTRLFALWLFPSS
ncbi:MAG: antibiotic biosynthesis monooxygenase [Chloroflexota bacterium]